MNDPTTQARPARVSTRIIGSVDVTLAAYLGDAVMTVGDLAALKTDDVVPLDAPLGRSVELRLNSVPIARGELVAVGDAFGVRLTDIVSCSD